MGPGLAAGVATRGPALASACSAGRIEAGARGGLASGRADAEAVIAALEGPGATSAAVAARGIATAVGSTTVGSIGERATPMPVPLGDAGGLLVA